MATYYMRADGTAANKAAATGPSSNVAACMNVTVHNGETFSANDIIILSDVGGTYRTQMNCPSSGTAGNPITYQAEGAPILSGFDIMTGFADGGSNIWDKTGVTTQPLGTIVNGAPMKKMAASRAACTAAGDWFWTANTLSVYATSDPSGNVEAGQRDRAIDGGVHDNLTFTDLTITGANDTGILIRAGSNILLDGMTVVQNPGVGVELLAGTDAVTIQNCTLDRSGAVNLLLLDGPAATNFSLLSTTVSDSGWRDLSAGNCSGMSGYIASGEIAYNTFTDNGAVATSEVGTEHGIYQGAVDGCTATCHHNTVTGTTKGYGIKWQGSGTVYSNTLDDNRAGIMVGVNGTFNATATVRHNVIANSWGTGIVQQAKGSGTLTVKLYHNTVYNSETHAFGNAGGYEIEDALTVLDVRNNIFSIGGSGRMVWLKVTQTGTVTINYNDVYDPGEATLYRIGAVEMDLATWQSNGYDANGFNSDPLFVNPT